MPPTTIRTRTRPPRRTPTAPRPAPMCTRPATAVTATPTTARSTLIQRSDLDADVAARALAIFDRIAEVEAALHGVSVAEVTFHELGAIDSIIDIVGVAAALSWLQPRRVVARTVPLGSGMVRTAHGLLPVPAPATLALLVGAKVEHGGPACELTTPTGAAILAANVSEYGPLPAMRILGVGHGAGTRELSDRPNLLRVVAGTERATVHRAPVELAEAGDGGEHCVVLETNIDDMNPQLYEPLLAGLLADGARDVWLTPVQMKKGRPGIVVSVLCDPARRDLLSDRLLRESTSSVCGRTRSSAPCSPGRSSRWPPSSGRSRSSSGGIRPLPSCGTSRPSMSPAATRPARTMSR